MTNKCSQLARECLKCFLKTEGKCNGIYFNDEMNLNKISLYCQKQMREQARRKKKK